MIFVTLENFEEEVLNSRTPCVVVFKSAGCHLCRGLDRVITRLELRYKQKFKFVFVDTPEEEGLVEIFNVDGVPTIFLFIDGDGREIPYPSEPDVFTGYSEEYLVNYLSKIIV